jgi:hypothetical protein
VRGKPRRDGSSQIEFCVNPQVVSGCKAYYYAGSSPPKREQAPISPSPQPQRSGPLGPILAAGVIVCAIVASAIIASRPPGRRGTRPVVVGRSMNCARAIKHAAESYTGCCGRKKL